MTEYIIRVLFNTDKIENFHTLADNDEDVLVYDQDYIRFDSVQILSNLTLTSKVILPSCNILNIMYYPVPPREETPND